MSGADFSLTAWRLIVSASTGAGVRGHVFVMSPGTLSAILTARQVPVQDILSTRFLYGIVVRLTDRAPLGHITLERRT